MGSLQDIAQVVKESSHCNSAQLNVTEDGTIIVPTLNWADFFAPYLKKINGSTITSDFHQVSQV